MEKNLLSEYFILLNNTVDKNIHPVYVKESPGAQLGLFAGKSFAVGEQIYAERPFLIVPAYSKDVSTTASKIEDIIEKATPTQREHFFSLSDKYELSGKPRSCIGIVETNGLPMGEEVDGEVPESAGLYSLICKNIFV